jgi:hypothetical protein
MKTILSSTFAFSILFFGYSGILEARDLTYKIGAGYKQISTNGFSGGGPDTSNQINGVSMSYGLAQDMMVEGFFGMTQNFHQFIVGPSFRYDIHRLITRDSRFWEHLNLFSVVGFFYKGGSEVDSGIMLQLPNVGVEIFPFRDTHFAIQTQAGINIDFVEESMIGFTQGMFGDVGIRFYF